MLRETLSQNNITQPWEFHMVPRYITSKYNAKFLCSAFFIPSVLNNLQHLKLNISKMRQCIPSRYHFSCPANQQPILLVWQAKGLGFILDFSRPPHPAS